MDNIPNDPAMLLSFVNLKLRDFYDSLEAMCEDMGINKDTVVNKLMQIDYCYNPTTNQFE